MSFKKYQLPKNINDTWSWNVTESQTNLTGRNFPMSKLGKCHKNNEYRNENVQRKVKSFIERISGEKKTLRCGARKGGEDK